MFVFDPGVIVLLALFGGLYARAVRILARRGYEVPIHQQISWWAGIAMQAVALLGPLDSYAPDLMCMHMSQHLLLADIAVPFLLIGIRTPVLVFIPPRPVLVALARQRTARRVFRFLRSPLAAIPAYLVILYFWHFKFAFEGALRHPLIHALQHISFVFASVLVWWAALEPQRRRLRGELWKIPYIFASRMVSMFLGVAFVVSRYPVYHSFYGNRPRHYGLSPLADQQLAGGFMMTLDIIIMVAALIFFFYRASADSDDDDSRSISDPAVIASSV